MRSDLRDNTDTINKMIQFGTVKYGIVKQLKDRTRSDREINSDNDEERSSLPCSPVAECTAASSPEPAASVAAPIVPSSQMLIDCSRSSATSTEDHNHNNNIEHNDHENVSRDYHPYDRQCQNSPIKAETTLAAAIEAAAPNETYPVEETAELNHKSSNLPANHHHRHPRSVSPSASSPEQNSSATSHHNNQHNQTEEQEQEADHTMTEAIVEESSNDQKHRLNHHQSNLEGDNLPANKNDDEAISSNQNEKQQSERGSPPPTMPQFPSAPMTLEAIQNMQMAIAQFAAKTLANGGADNEAAMKQLAFLQQTLFNLQQQQIFQLQLIQQLQSQLALNQLKEGEDEEADAEDEINEDEDFDGEMEEETMAENLSNHKSDNSNIIITSDEKAVQNSHERVQTARRSSPMPRNEDFPLRKQESREDLRQFPADKPLPPPAIDENKPIPYGSDLASSIITNHDNPPSLDEPNSLEMLQKRAQEVLDSASQGILAGNLADEFAFGKDNNGDGKNRNEPFFKHRCRYCGKVFGSDSALQIHIRSHTGERPFKCNVCGSRFTTKGNLKVHFQRHAQKFPHVPMNSTPIPEHLDKFHPPLLEQMSPDSSPTHQPQMPNVPQNIPPVSLPLPFPPGAGFPGLPPMYRPPLDILKSLGPYSNPFFPGALPPLPPAKRDQDVPTDLRKPVADHSPEPKKTENLELPSPPHPESPTDEAVSLKIKEEREDEDGIEAKRPKSETPPRPVTPPRIQVEKKPTQQSSPRETHPIPPHHHMQLPPMHPMPPMPPMPPMLPMHHHLQMPFGRDDMHDRLPLNFTKPSPERSPIRSPASIPRSPFMGPLKPEMALLPRPHSNDNSWENFIEVSNTSETMKLKELMKNKKITDPNQCVVCDRVLSCKSALQMHYRTHTGERPFKCRICGRAFTTKGNLKTHMAVHKIRPPMRNFHQCPVCHKKYSNALVLQQHIRLHTGEPTDLTPEQIQAAEIRDFPPSMVPGSFLNPFAFNFGMGPPNGAMGSESSQGEIDDAMDCSDDFDDEDISDHLSNGGDSDRPKSGDDQIKDMFFEQKLKIDNNRPKSDASNSSAPTSPVSALNKSSPAPSDSSQGALDLTPRAGIPPPPSHPHPPPGLLHHARPPFGMFPNLPLFPPVSMSPSTQNMCNAMNSIAQSVMPSAPFNPLALSGVRGSTTCGICFKTFPCHSALEIHYRSHTKERPFKCTICDRGFTTKGNLKQHMLTHKIRDMEQDAFRNRAVKYVRAGPD